MLAPAGPQHTSGEHKSSAQSAKRRVPVKPRRRTPAGAFEVVHATVIHMKEHQPEGIAMFDLFRRCYNCADQELSHERVPHFLSPEALEMSTTRRKILTRNLKREYAPSEVIVNVTDLPDSFATNRKRYKQRFNRTTKGRTGIEFGCDPITRQLPGSLFYTNCRFCRKEAK